MVYGDFTSKTLKKHFDLQFIFKRLFSAIKPIAPSQRLLENLEIGQRAGFVTEKARSERLVTPILMELLNNNNMNFIIYSGMNLDIDSDKGLKGECDFILSHSNDPYAITAPVFSIVEAKKHDMEKGIIQCAAQLLGAQQLNEQEGVALNGPLYGCSTTGTEWNFLKLMNNELVIDIDRYHLSKPAQLLGILQHIVTVTRTEPLNR